MLDSGSGGRNGGLDALSDLEDELLEGIFAGQAEITREVRCGGSERTLLTYADRCSGSD